VAPFSDDYHYVVRPGFEQLIDKTEAGTCPGSHLHTLKVDPEKLSVICRATRIGSEFGAERRTVNFNLSASEGFGRIPVLDPGQRRNYTVTVSLTGYNVPDRDLAVLA